MGFHLSKYLYGPMGPQDTAGPKDDEFLFNLSHPYETMIIRELSVRGDGGIRGLFTDTGNYQGREFSS
jgi:hypothetical protein